MKTCQINRSKNKNDITRIDEGFIDGEDLLNIKGANDEHLLFKKNKYRRLSKIQFLALAESIDKNGMEYPVTIFVDATGKQTIIDET